MIQPKMKMHRGLLLFALLSLFFWMLSMAAVVDTKAHTRYNGPLYDLKFLVDADADADHPLDSGLEADGVAGDDGRDVAETLVRWHRGLEFLGFGCFFLPFVFLFTRL